MTRKTLSVVDNNNYIEHTHKEEYRAVLFRISFSIRINGQSLERVSLILKKFAPRIAQKACLKADRKEPLTREVPEI
jgi:hypothetical protein